MNALGRLADSSKEGYRRGEARSDPEIHRQPAAPQRRQVRPADLRGGHLLQPSPALHLPRGACTYQVGARTDLRALV
eukprot:1193616-Prorocentrum_minimum.AAC.1